MPFYWQRQAITFSVSLYPGISVKFELPQYHDQLFDHK